MGRRPLFLPLFLLDPWKSLSYQIIVRNGAESRSLDPISPINLIERKDFHTVHYSSYFTRKFSPIFLSFFIVDWRKFMSKILKNKDGRGEGGWVRRSSPGVIVRPSVSYICLINYGEYFPLLLFVWAIIYVAYICETYGRVVGKTYGEYGGNWDFFLLWVPYFT